MKPVCLIVIALLVVAQVEAGNGNTRKTNGGGSHGDTGDDPGWGSWASKKKDKGDKGGNKGTMNWDSWKGNSVKGKEGSKGGGWNDWWSSVDGCEEGWEIGKHSCFKFVADTVTWSDAKDGCEALQGKLTLAPSGNRKKSRKIQKMRENFEKFGIESAWFDKAKEWGGGWWNKKNPTTTESTNTEESCTFLTRTGDASMSTAPCGELRSYVCERRQKTKGVCPDTTDTNTTDTVCKNECDTEYNCTRGQICCGDGCSVICTYPAKEPAHENATTGGNSFGAPCAFPFTYLDKTYHACTSVKPDGVSQYRFRWCSTTAACNALGTQPACKWGMCPKTERKCTYLTQCGVGEGDCKNNWDCKGDMECAKTKKCQEPDAISTECMPEGEKYTGPTAVTNTGIKCQRWDAQTPHGHQAGNKDSDFPGNETVSSAANYCRNMDEDKPWCYTTDNTVRWQYCTVLLCDTTSTTTGNTTGDEEVRRRRSVPNTHSGPESVVRHKRGAYWKLSSGDAKEAPKRHTAVTNRKCLGKVKRDRGNDLLSMACSWVKGWVYELSSRSCVEEQVCKVWNLWHKNGFRTQKQCENDCADDCTSDMALWGYNNKFVYSVASQHACVQHCAAETSFVCRSIDYRHTDNRCTLSSQDKNSKPHSYKPTTNSFTYCTVVSEAQQCTTLYCSSHGNRFQRCILSLPGKVQVELVKKHSRRACVFGDSYGISADHKSIWVKKGCRGQFKVCDKKTSADVRPLPSNTDLEGWGFLESYSMPGKCVDVDGYPAMHDAAKVQLMDCEYMNVQDAIANVDQLWRLEENGHLVSRPSSKCLDVQGWSSTAEDQRIQQYTCEYPVEYPDCHNGKAIALHNNKEIPDIATRDQCVQLCQNETDFKCRSIDYGGKTKTMCKLSVETKETIPMSYRCYNDWDYCTVEDDEKKTDHIWEFRFHEDTPYFQIYNKNCGKCLDISGHHWSQGVNGDKAQTQTCQGWPGDKRGLGSSDQWWKFVSLTDMSLSNKRHVTGTGIGHIKLPQSFVQDWGFFESYAHPGKCIDVQGWPAKRDDSKVQLYDCEYMNLQPHFRNVDQLWKLKANGHIVSRPSGKCLDPEGCPHKADNTSILMAKCDKTDFNTDHQWEFRRHGDSGYFQIYNQIIDKCLDIAVHKNIAKNGDHAQTYTCDEWPTDESAVSDRWWKFVKLRDIFPVIEDAEGNGNDAEGDDDDDTTGTGIEGLKVPESFIRDWGFFESYSMPGKCLDVAGWPAKRQNAKLQLWDCEYKHLFNGNFASVDQIWKIQDNGHIITRPSGKCMDVQPSRRNSKLIGQHDCEDTELADSDHIWEQRYHSDTEYFQLYNKKMDKCLDIAAMSQGQNGDAAQTQTCEGWPGEKPGPGSSDHWWKFVPLTDHITVIEKETDHSVECPDYWHSFQGKCYLYTGVKVALKQAALACETAGGNLAALHSQEHLTFYDSVMTKLKLGSMWLGQWKKQHNDSHHHLRHMVTDDIIHFAPWAEGEPNQASEEGMSCVYLLDGEISDASCGDGHGFICEKQPLKDTSQNTSLCSLAPKVGQCEAAFVRWFYNANVGQCQIFVYGGCMGNGNNFNTRDECHQLCHGYKEELVDDKDKMTTVGTEEDTNDVTYEGTTDNVTDKPKEMTTRGDLADVIDEIYDILEDIIGEDYGGDSNEYNDGAGNGGQSNDQFSSDSGVIFDVSGNNANPTYGVDNTLVKVEEEIFGTK